MLTLPGDPFSLYIFDSGSRSSFLYPYFEVWPLRSNSGGKNVANFVFVLFILVQMGTKWRQNVQRKYEEVDGIVERV